MSKGSFDPNPIMYPQEACVLQSCTSAYAASSGVSDRQQSTFCRCALMSSTSSSTAASSSRHASCLRPSLWYARPSSTLQHDHLNACLSGDLSQSSAANQTRVFVLGSTKSFHPSIMLLAEFDIAIQRAKPILVADTLLYLRARNRQIPGSRRETSQKCTTCVRTC